MRWFPLVLVIAGCGSVSEDQCDDGPSDLTVITGAAAADDGTLALAVSRQRVDAGGCDVVSRSGAVYVVPPSEDAAFRIGLPTQTGAVIVDGRTALVLSGTWSAGGIGGGIYGPGSGGRIHAIDLDTGERETRELPSPAIQLLSASGVVAIPLPSQRAILLGDTTMPVPGLETAIEAWGRIWVATTGDSIAEIDVALASEVRRLDACAVSAFAPVADRTLLLACSPWGFAILDVVNESVAILDTSRVLTVVRGSPVSTTAFVGVLSETNWETAQRFVLGSGLVASGTLTGGERLGDVAFTSSGAFVSFADYGNLVFVAPDGSEEILFSYDVDVGRLVQSGGSVIALGNDWEGGLSARWIDPVTREVTRGPVRLDVVTGDGGGVCSIGRFATAPLALLLLLLAPVAFWQRFR